MAERRCAASGCLVDGHAKHAADLTRLGEMIARPFASMMSKYREKLFIHRAKALFPDQHDAFEFADDNAMLVATGGAYGHQPLFRPGL